MKTVIIVVTILIVIIVAVSLTYLNIKNRKECPVLLNEIVKGNQFNINEKCRMITEEEIPDGLKLPDAKIKNVSIPELKGSKKMTLNLWIKPENQTDNFSHTNNSIQHILEWGDNLYLQYEPVRNELVIQIKAYITDKLKYQEFRIANALGIQKWNMVTLTFDNRYVDLYVNGKLHKAIFLSNVPVLDDSDEWLLFKQKGFFGKVTAIRYFNYNLQKKEVERLYSGTKGNPPSNGLWWMWVRLNSLNSLL